MTAVRANAVSGRVLVEYRPGVTPARLQHLLEDAVARLLKAPAAAVGASGTWLRDTSAAPLVRLLTRTPELRRLTMRGAAAAILDRLFEAAPPLMIGTGVDIVTRGPESVLGQRGITRTSSQIAALGGIAGVVWILDSVMGYLHKVTSTDLAAAVRRDLRNEVFEHLQLLDPARVESEPVSHWIGLLDDDIGRIASFVANGIDPIVTMATNSLIVASTFLRAAPLLAAVQMLTIPGLWFVSTRLLQPIKRRQQAQRDDESALSNVLYDDVAGTNTIASFGQEQRVAARIRALGERLLRSTRRTVLVAAAYVPSIQLVVGVGFIVTLVVGARLAVRGSLPVAAYNIMGYASLRLLAALGSLGYSLEQYQRTNVSVERIRRVLDERPAIADGVRMLPARPSGEITFDDVTFGYEPQRAVLEHVSMRFPAGKTTGIVGLSGAGKTTVLKLLRRFYEVRSGAIRIDGEDVRDLRLAALRGAMSIVPQSIYLFTGTVRENIAFGRPDASDAEVVGAARIAHAHDFIERLPDGYDTVIGRGREALSGGEQQRLAIARSLLTDSPIMLFDEATSSIDSATEAALRASLQEATRGRTTVIVAHRMATVRHADVIYVLDGARVREFGTHDELIAADGMYANMWRIQLGERPALTKPPR